MTTTVICLRPRRRRLGRRDEGSKNALAFYGVKIVEQMIGETHND
jgi:hypothetical protein